ncbi:hypothetical protein SLEP1_g58119 [Rubroshorea leprosula]|uniref:ATP synthase F0 subunit 8 n=1 Tax=Rubroshorea leprosula TaxID=152421 RepID=A0AAV5MQP5_9ROSI|nr:hypothetical protein SLEP1_g58119 [Rubroshorea leprosula]
MNLPSLALNCLGFTLIALISFNFWVARELPLQIPPASSPTATPILLVKLRFLIVLSV